MLNLLRSDIYKIFKRMSFYICLLVSVVSAGYGAWTFEETVKNMYKQRFGGYASLYGLDFDSMTAKDLGITAWAVLNQSVPFALTMSAIFITIFLGAEFNSGMCKSVILRGKGKVSYYFSKLISLMIVPIIYTVVMCGVNFGVGAYKFQGVDWNNEYIDAYFIPLGWFMLVAFTWVSLLCMICFLCRSSGFSMAINLGLLTKVIPLAIIAFVTYVSKQWFNVIDVKYDEYWFGDYDALFLSGQGSSGDEMMKYVYTLCGWFFVPIIIGALCFKKREIK